jgi:hypothetical protein
MGDIMTTNTTSFARHYLAAAEALMDAIADPSAATFNEAHSQAILAIGAAFTVPGASGGSIEWDLGQELARSVENAARAHGYVGIPAARKEAGS